MNMRPLSGPARFGYPAHMDKQEKPADAFAAFKNLARKLVNVPKKEVDAKESAYQRRKARKKRKSS